MEALALFLDPTGAPVSEMRVDHLAFQRAVNIAGFGFLLQAVLGAILLIVGLSLDDTSSVVASLWCLIGLVVWLGLLIVFNQHRLERLEALEQEDLSSDTSAIFEHAGEDGLPAARRLRSVYRWIMPGVSVLYAGGLAVAGWLVMRWMASLESEASAAEFMMSSHLGWMVAIYLTFAVASFIMSRFLAGMAQQDAWRHLRGGAGVMIGNALVLLAGAIGETFRFFDLDGVIEGVVWGVAAFMVAVAIEVVLGLILNVYRPRSAGDFPRAAHDSSTLSLLTRPDSFVRSINEAVNYQFGFDISSSWGYQLLLRSGAWLVALAIVALLAMSTVVVVGGRDEGLRLQWGRIVGEPGSEVRPSGLMMKLPWPIEQSDTWDVTTVRQLAVTPPEAGPVIYNDWANPARLLDRAMPVGFIVRPSESSDGRTDDSGESASNASGQESAYSLVTATISVQWRPKGVHDGSEPSALLSYLDFGGERVQRRSMYTDRDRMIRALLLSETTRYLGGLTLDDALANDRAALGEMLRGLVQDRLDTLDAGIEVVSVDLPSVAPPKDSVRSFEDLPVAIQQSDSTVARAERDKTKQLTTLVGRQDLIDPVIQAIDAVDAARNAMLESDDADRDALKRDWQQAVEHAELLLRQGGGAAYQVVSSADLLRWVELMDHRSQVSRVRGQEAAWKVSPDIFQQRAIMEIYARNLPYMRKFVLGIKPEQLDLSYEVRELAAPNMIFSDMLSDEQAKQMEP